ncbi:MAG: GDSL-type esterase/lipase family protein [Ruminococcus sp.]|nr:GDSL-type esterase/lipase family protein [Ruminococcus sp.]
MKHRFLSILTAAAAAIGCVGMGYASTVSSRVAADDSDTLKILAVGDSITHGYNSSTDGYRKYLCYYLQNAGFTDFDMVGPNSNWTDFTTYTLSTSANGIAADTTITYDPAHAGYSGFSIQSYSERTGIYETIFDTMFYDSDWNEAGNMIEAYESDMILLQIGTNDLLDAHNDGITDRLKELIDEIELYLDDGAVLFVASVPDIDAEVRNDWLTAYGYTYGTYYSDDPEGFIALVESYVDAYNESVEALVEEKQVEGYNIYFSDINSVVDMETGLDDGVHPNDEGYACMGEYWSELILLYVNGNTDNPVTTTTNTTTTTTTSTTTTTDATNSTTTTTTTSIITTTDTTNSTTESITGLTTESTMESTTSSTEISTDSQTEKTEITSTTSETEISETETTVSSDTDIITETTTTETSATETTTTTSSTKEADDILIGDVNLDDNVVLADVIALQCYLIRNRSLSSQAYLCVDLTKDSRVNGFDLVLLRQNVLLQAN